MVMAPRKRMGFGKKLLIGAATILTLGAAGAWLGRDTLSKEIEAFRYRNNPSVVAAIPGPQRNAVRKTMALQEEAIKIRGSLVKEIDAKYQPGGRFSQRGKKAIIGNINAALAHLLRAEDAFLNGNKAQAKALLAAAEASLNQADAGIRTARPLKADGSVAWPGDDRAEAQAEIGRLRKIAAGILAALGLG